MSGRRPAADAGTGAALALLTTLAGLFVLPDIPLDADVLKTALCALVAVPLACLVLGAQGGEGARTWFAGAGGRLFTASVLLAALGSALSEDFGGPLSSAVVDRVLQVLLALTAAGLGAAAARRLPALPARVLVAVGAVVALVCLAQALGWEDRLSPPAEETAGFKEVVGTLGNSNRAGALLALALAAALGLALRPATVAGLRRTNADGGSAARGPGPARLALLSTALLSAALMLTRSRGGRLAALLALVAVLWALRPALRHAATALAPVLVGAALAVALGGGDVLWARKLPDSAPVLSGHDPTTGVRLALWSSTVEMTADRPLLGWGLGRFREAFPPYRDAAEAALPGLQGAATVVWHPHDEYLLAAAEGGWTAGALLLLFALLTVRRALSAWRHERGPEELAMLGVVTAGAVLAALQDAWVSPGSGVAYFVAAGFVWGSGGAVGAHAHHVHPDAPSRRGPALAAGLLLALASAGLAWPRWAGHLGAWRFQRAAQQTGIDTHNFALLTEAAAAAPADADLQRMLVYIGRQLLPVVPPDDRAAVSAALADAVLRLEALPPPQDQTAAPR